MMLQAKRSVLSLAPSQDVRTRLEAINDLPNKGVICGEARDVRLALGVTTFFKTFVLAPMLEGDPASIWSHIVPLWSERRFVRTHYCRDISLVVVFRHELDMVNFKLFHC